MLLVFFPETKILVLLEKLHSIVCISSLVLHVFVLCTSGTCGQCVLPGPGCPGDQVSHRQPKTMETL